MWENVDQNNSEYEHFLRSDNLSYFLLTGNSSSTNYMIFAKRKGFVTIILVIFKRDFLTIAVCRR